MIRRALQGIAALACILAIGGCFPRYNYRYNYQDVRPKKVYQVRKVQVLEVVKVKKKRGRGHAYGNDRKY